MMRRLPATIIADLLIFLLLLAAVAGISIMTYSPGSGYLEVRTHEAIFRYSMSTDQQIEVNGPLGKTHIIIEDGAAKIVDSSCPTKSCTLQKPISLSGKWIACLPNHVLLTVVGAPTDLEVDDVAI